MIEQFKWALGYEGIYEVSNFGNIISYKVDKVNGKQMLPSEYANELITVSFQKKVDGINKSKTFKIHRLVYELFHTEELPKQYNVSHIDGNKHNNHISNLMAKTNAEINVDGKSRPKQLPGTGKKQVAKYSLAGEFIEIYESTTAAAKANAKVYSRNSMTPIRKCCQKIENSAYGFIWEYVI